MIIDKINSIRPKGVTPISYALLQSANDFPSQAGYRNILILITDGIESCGGDPCATSIALQKKGVFLQPYIIGIGMKSEKSLECAGTYLNADTPSKFYDALNRAIQKSFLRTTVTVILNGPNQKKETNINVSFLNSNTGKPMYEFVHYLDKNRLPDSVFVDPMVDYDLVVNTLPPIIKQNVEITEGEHTTVTIPVLQGGLTIKQEDGSITALQALVREKGKAEVLNTQPFNQNVKYLAGNYEVETLTIPRRKYNVQITADKTFTLTVPSPGLANFNTITTGYGSLYEIASDGTEQWVCNLDDLKSVFTMSLLPGHYRIVFRVKHSFGSKYTSYKNFTIKSGKTQHVNVFE
jgi:Ca-activated chloride channel family protein